MKDSKRTACGCFSLGVEREVKLQGLFSSVVFICFRRMEAECHEIAIASSGLVSPKSAFTQKTPSKLIIYYFVGILFVFLIPVL